MATIVKTMMTLMTKVNQKKSSRLLDHWRFQLSHQERLVKPTKQYPRHQQDLRHLLVHQSHHWLVPRRQREKMLLSYLLTEKMKSDINRTALLGHHLWHTILTISPTRHRSTSLQRRVAPTGATARGKCFGIGNWSEPFLLPKLEKRLKTSGEYCQTTWDISATSGWQAAGETTFGAQCR